MMRLKGSLHLNKSKSKSFNRGEKCIQEHLYKHFESERHTEFLDDVSITFIDNTDESNTTKRENYWMRTLKTFAPYGFNAVDSIQVGTGDVGREEIYLVFGISRIWILTSI